MNVVKKKKQSCKFGKTSQDRFPFAIAKNQFDADVGKSPSPFGPGDIIMTHRQD